MLRHDTIIWRDVRQVIGTVGGPIEKKKRLVLLKNLSEKVTRGLGCANLILTFAS